MLALQRQYIVMVSKTWGRAISGPVLAVIGLVLLMCQLAITDSKLAAEVLKYCSWTTLSVAGFMVFVAQYQVWKEEYEDRSKTAEILGDITIEMAHNNPYADQTRVGSALRYICDCSKFGKAACEISEAWIEISAPRQPKFAIIDEIPAQVVEPGRAFRYQRDLLVAGVSPVDLRAAAINVCLFDSLKNPYSHTITKISPRILTDGRESGG